MDPTVFLFSLLPHQFGIPACAVIATCAVIDAAVPQPKIGSKWVIPRKIISYIGMSWGWAKNRIQPGSPDSTVTNADIIRKVIETQAAAEQVRSEIQASIVPIAKAVVPVLSQDK